MAKKQDNEGKSDGTSLILKNKKAFFEYEVLEKLECGISLRGTEVKSLRDRKVSFADAYAQARNGKLLLKGLNISEYNQTYYDNHEPTRTRTLLAHKKEIAKLESATAEKGLTLIPLRLYWKRGKAKVEIGLARGKARHDKRETIKNREMDRERQRMLRR